VNVRVSLRDPAFDASQNILATIRLLQAALMTNHPIQRFIFASSGGAIYGSQKTYPTPEDAPLKPESPYGLAKLTAEHYIRFFQKTYGLKAVILRYANVYGPRQDPMGEAGVISIFADLFLKGETPTIYGDGAQTRDFVYVKDVARANLAALNPDIDGIFNIGTANETTVNEIADQIRRLTKSENLPKHASPIPGELDRSVIDISRAAKHLKWAPLTNLESGLAETIQSLRH
jgi:UDP-glucose 4-epimerase